MHGHDPHRVVVGLPGDRLDAVGPTVGLGGDPGDELGQRRAARLDERPGRVGQEAVAAPVVTGPTAGQRQLDQATLPHHPGDQLVDREPVPLAVEDRELVRAPTATGWPSKPSGGVAVRSPRAADRGASRPARRRSRPARASAARRRRRPRRPGRRRRRGWPAAPAPRRSGRPASGSRCGTGCPAAPGPARSGPAASGSAPAGRCRRSATARRSSRPTSHPSARMRWTSSASSSASASRISPMERVLDRPADDQDRRARPGNGPVGIEVDVGRLGVAVVDDELAEDPVDPRQDVGDRAEVGGELDGVGVEGGLGLAVERDVGPPEAVDGLLRDRRRRTASRGRPRSRTSGRARPPGGPTPAARRSRSGAGRCPGTRR